MHLCKTVTGIGTAHNSEINQQISESLNQNQEFVEFGNSAEASFGQAQIRRSPSFENYYLEVFQDYFKEPSEYQRFINQLRDDLPITFRINENVPNHKNFIAQLKNPNYMASKFSEDSSNDRQGTNFTPQVREEMENLNGDDKAVDSGRKISELKGNTILRPLEWYPNELAWQMNVTRKALKKDPYLKKLNQYIQRAAESGLITRQEMVSMLPPLFMDIQSADLVLDMCAAPGSKTVQLLQALYRDEFLGKGPTQGGIVANDVNYRRASILGHQVKRNNTSAIAVVNHQAQNFPTLSTVGHDGAVSKLCFDKILADVPCTGDGALRKNSKLWENWATDDAIIMHQTQVSILQKALQIAKIGGLILYSTCSLNPLENEAVLTEIFRKSNHDSIELIDIHQLYPGLISRRGLSRWKVCEETEDYKLSKQAALRNAKKFSGSGLSADFHSLWSNRNREKIFNIYEEMSDVPVGYKGKVHAGLFPADEETMFNSYKIQNALRVLPHDQNSGGFFVALIRKKKETSSAEKVHFSTIGSKKISSQQGMPHISREPSEVMSEDASSQVNRTPSVQEKQILKAGCTYAHPNWVPLVDPEWKKIYEFYGIDEELLRDKTLRLTENEKSVFIITPGIRKFLLNDSKGVLKILNVGAKLFKKNRDTLRETDSPYRISQSAVKSAFPFLTKRKIKVSASAFKELIKKRNVTFDNLEDRQLLRSLEEISEGPVLLFSHDDGDIMDLDCIVAFKYKASIKVLVSDELLESFSIRYLEP